MALEFPENPVDKLNGVAKFSRMFPAKNKLSILVALLFVSAFVSAACALLHYRATGELRGLQRQAMSVESNRTLTRALAADAVEYSKRNPAIDPLLRSFGLKQPVSSPKAAK